MKFVAMSLMACSGKVWLLNAICKIGTLEALYLNIKGAVVPGGRILNKLNELDAS
ncbi:hypothetical protein MYP_1620 [Sporocytophaga myxococcoides]|uniref:Uncharacterized protein n=1 Tax=Sporocytophaga myxococcoides TaxID=153721 RepID=A0A098LE41_9BACT|nr:hypothetical protein MYP_1620 [Sporocytophaga myxococcoides]